MRGEQDGKERRWSGLGVSDGIAWGRALRIHGGARYIYRATLEDEADVAREMRRLRAAFRLARRQLLAIKRRAEQELGADHAYIFDAHLLMLEDRKLLEEALQRIRRERVNAEWAVKVVADRLLAIYAEIKDDYLRERGSDIEDVARRILVALSGEPPPSLKLTEDSIIVAEELLPSTAAELDFAQVRAIASDGGGWTSHTAIIARGLGIPAVVGLRDLFRHARTGDLLIVDAMSGEVVLRPSAETEAYYREKARIRAARVSAPLPSITEAARARPLLTADGEEIILRANVELPAEYGGVRRYGARGIGLYRSEFLWSQRGVMPSEEEQYRAYSEIGELAGEDGATVRLFDLGGEKMSLPGAESERNPALGLRAIRLGLRYEDLMRTQVRAILRAAARGRLDIVLPMISDASEARKAKR
ncbi:MAG: phosphoenolpyruvate--protein phosphotransferase, partial [Acidobacteria bacterium]|nr:phosphoenolpyruvate--protein phosphotransferase [Acidobacteriota bacterium]